MAGGAKSASRRLPRQVFVKAAHMMKEGKSREQAIGAGAGMYRSGRLTDTGKYIRVKGR